jgi:copper(I)-binding protein
MKRTLATLAATAAILASAQGAVPVSVEQAWARPTLPGTDTSAAYMTLTAREPLTLVGASTPAAGIVEIHEMRMEGDVMKMRAAESLPLAVGKPLQLKPGGYHLMLMDLKAPFQAGNQVTVTLRFRDARGAEQALPVTMPVRAMGAQPMHQPMHQR